ncbi:hypothetical protein PT110_08400 [Erysipelothrix rhusiopathiae]|nr:hypothetical protein [Erysipelothrix rhusiopathiae]
MKKKSTTKELIVMIVVAFISINFLVLYISDLINKIPLRIIHYLNPIAWLSFYQDKPQILLLLALTIAVIFLLSWNNSKDFITEHEDVARMATDEEIDEAFGRMKIK